MAPPAKSNESPLDSSATNGDASSKTEVKPDELEAESISAEQTVSQEKVPICEVAELMHRLRVPAEEEEEVSMGEGGEKSTKKSQREEDQDKLVELIKRHDMLPLYRKVCKDFNWPLDGNLVKSMEEKHKEELERLESRLEEAQEKYGDVEIRDVLLSRANFYCRIGDVKQAEKAYQLAYEKTVVGAGGRIDITLSLIRLGFVYGETDMIKTYLARAEEELKRGGDWERRNKMKIYKGLYLLTTRQFKEAGLLFLSVLATFPVCALLSFKKFIFYAVLLSLLTEDRQVLKEEVIHSPAILEGADEELKQFLHCFYFGKYREFMTLLCPVGVRIKRDVYLGRHFLYIIRSLRLRAYHQFLEPYKTVTIDNMAFTFGVSPSFIEEEVGSFISSGKLSCRIDRVNRVIESNRPDERSRSYLRILKQGDLLLNRIQKLSRVIAM